MKTYLTLLELVNATKARYAEKTDYGWRPRRKRSLATHELHYFLSYGQVDKGAVFPHPIKKPTL